MAFGDAGRWHVNVNGVPFRMDGESYEEAEARVLDTLADTPELFDLRAQRLGLDQKDLDALEIRFGSGDAGLKGLVRAEQAVNSPINKTLIGSGRSFVNRWRGARQAIAQVFGDEEAAKAIAREDEDERKLYQQLDDTGVGLEDLGEIGTDIAAFIGATTLTGGGAVPMFVTGAALGASDVKDEVPTGNLGETGIEEGRGLDAALGGAFALTGPLLSKGRAAVSSLASKLGLGGSVKASPGAWLRIRSLFARPEAMTNIVDDVLTYTADGADAAKAVIGRAALEKLQLVMRSLPAEGAEGLKNSALMGIIRNAAKKATTPAADGTNVFNPAVWEREMTPLLGRLGGMFKAPDHARWVAGLNTLAAEMQKLPNGISPAAAERAAAALTASLPESEPILKALQLASNPSVKSMLMDALVERGAAAMTGLSQSIPGSVLAGTASNVATEGAEDVGEVIGNRNRDAGR